MTSLDREKAQIIEESIRRFPQLPIRTIARYVLHNYGPLFDGDFERIRSRIRFALGKTGDTHREEATRIISRTGKIVLPQTWRRKRKPFKLNSGLWLVMGDPHIPFHEPKPIEAAIKYGQENNVTGLLLNGDAQDCASVTFWPSMQKRDFDGEVEKTIDFLDFIDQELPNVEKIYKPGNHEFRLPRYFAAKAPELIGMPLQAINTVLGLEYRNIEFLDYHQIVMAGKLPIIHGHEMRISTPVNPARGLFLKTKTWAMCAHFHRTSEHTSTNLQGTLLTTWSLGCLCDLSPDYNPYGNDWNWGFALINVENGGDFEVFNKRVLPNGKVA